MGCFVLGGRVWIILCFFSSFSGCGGGVVVFCCYVFFVLYF